MAKVKKKKNSLLKTGADADAEVSKVEAEIKARQEKANDPWRFWLKPDEEDIKVVFLDGHLKENGLLEKTSFYEHQVELQGNWNNHFVCIAENEPCPICEDGRYDKKFISVFTIIDTRQYVSQKDNKKYKNQKRLFACTSGTLKQLQKLATKHGGLAGNVFELSRTGSKKPKVGDIITWDKKISLKKLGEKLGEEETTPYDYEEVFKVYTAEELGQFGFSSSSVGSEVEVEDDDIDDSEFDDELEEEKPKKEKKKEKVEEKVEEETEDELDISDSVNEEEDEFEI